MFQLRHLPTSLRQVILEILTRKQALKNPGTRQLSVNLMCVRYWLLLGGTCHYFPPFAFVPICFDTPTEDHLLSDLMLSLVLLLVVCGHANWVASWTLRVFVFPSRKALGSILSTIWQTDTNKVHTVPNGNQFGGSFSGLGMRSSEYLGLIMETRLYCECFFM